MKKGFTLIELLAVIVILAIISLIAVPIVVNIINDTKKSSNEQSVELYIDTVKKMITKKQLSNPNFNPDSCNIKDNGDLECYKDNKKIDTLKVEMKGKIPKSGTILLNNNKIYYKNIFCENLYYHKNKKNIKSTTKQPKYAELISDADNNNEVSIGDKYTYQVNKNDVFNFYVLSINSDNTVNLIMDRNICEDGTTNYTEENNYCRYAWNSNSSSNRFGPVTAMTNLANGTRNWCNVPNMNLSYDDSENNNIGSYGYMGVTIIDGVGYITKKDGTEKKLIIVEGNLPIKSRLAKYSEVNQAECTTSVESCPTWLVENLRYYGTNNNKYSVNSKNILGTDIYNIHSYLLLSSHSDDHSSARYVDCTGTVSGTSVSNGSLSGIRPVITVPISDLGN